MNEQLSTEFRFGEPLLPQTWVGEFVALRMVHPWGLKYLWQVRLLTHGDTEICISPSVRERDTALLLARRWFKDEAERLLAMAESIGQDGAP